jgi:uncharacterized protein
MEVCPFTVPRRSWPSGVVTNFDTEYRGPPSILSQGVMIFLQESPLHMIMSAKEAAPERVFMPIHSINSTDREQVLVQLQAIKPELVKQYSISKIGIFGSVARNEGHDNSDIDVVVHMQPNLLKRVRLKAELEEIFGREVDIIRYRESMNPFLKARIQQDAIYV